MTAAKALQAVPVGAWVALAGVGLVYFLGRRALGNVNAAGIGETLGRGVAELAGGAISGVASGAGSIAGAVIKAPSQVVDSAVQTATDGRGLSLGSWFYDLVNEPYNPNAPAVKPADERAWYEQLWGRVTQ